MSSENSARVPAIVRIVAKEATRRRAMGAITDAIFVEQMGRIIREELEPKGLTLLVRDLSGGRTRFLIKRKATGTVCDMMDFSPDGSLEPETSEWEAQASESQAVPA